MYKVEYTYKPLARKKATRLVSAHTNPRSYLPAVSQRESSKVTLTASFLHLNKKVGKVP